MVLLNPALISELPPQTAQDPTFWTTLISRNPNLWPHAPDALVVAHPEIVREAIRQSPNLVLQIPINRILQNGALTSFGASVWQLALMERPSLLRESPHAIRNQDFIAGLAYYNPEIAAYLDDALMNNRDFLLRLAHQNFHVLFYLSDTTQSASLWQSLLAELDIVEQAAHLPDASLNSYDAFKNYFENLIGSAFFQRVHRLGNALRLADTHAQIQNGHLTSSEPVFFVAGSPEDQSGAFRQNPLLDTLLEDTRVRVVVANVRNQWESFSRAEDFHRLTGRRVHSLIIAAHTDPVQGMTLQSRNNDPDARLSSEDAATIAPRFEQHVERNVFFFGCSAGIALVKPFVQESSRLAYIGPDRPTNIASLRLNSFLDFEITWQDGAQSITSRPKVSPHR